MKPIIMTVSMLILLCACESNGQHNPPPANLTLSGTLYAAAQQDLTGTILVACYMHADTCHPEHSSSLTIHDSGTQTPFVFEGLQAAAYELVAFKDMDGDDEVSNGDFFGELGRTVTPPANGLTLRMQRVTDAGTPRTPARFFVFSGDDVRTTTNPRVEVDAAGGVHMVFPAYALSDAFYAYCPADCAEFSRMSVVTLPTLGTVDNAMIALDTTGTPHVLLSTYQRIYYATCHGDCREQNAWRVDMILEHDGTYEVSGEAFTLDPTNQPRFLMHPFRSFNSSDAGTWLMVCNALCDEASHWERHLVSSQRWQESSLRYAADGSLHVGTTVTIDGVGDGIAYLRCVNACTHEASWDGVALYKAFSDVYVSDIRPVVSLALTGDGRPRMLALGDDDAGGRNLIYFECNNACADNNNWQLNALISGDSALDIGPGLDLALSNDAPRFVYTADYNVLIAGCDTNCASGDANNWRLSTVELSHDIPKDDVIPYHNCTVSAWFLSHPSLAISADDVPRVAYRAQDISGSNTPVDPNHPPCNTGADMTLTRFAQLTNPD